MKKLIYYFALLIIITSCKVLPAPHSYSTFINYTTLTERGFFVTESNSVNFDYLALGSVSVVEKGGWINKNEKKQAQENSDDFYYSGNFGKKKYTLPDIETALFNLGDRLSEMGATGVINLKIDVTPEYNATFKVYVDKLTITGMAIKE